MFNFLEKTKEAPNLKIKILCPKRQISIYITPKKTRTDHSILNHFFNVKCILWKKTISSHGFFDKNNCIITLLLSTIIYILVNKKINSETLVSFNILYNNFIQCLFIVVFRIIFYLYFLLIKYNHLPINYLHCFVNCYLVITITTINHHVIF